MTTPAQAVRTARSRFDRAWPRLEVLGLRFTGIWIVFLGAVTLSLGYDSPLTSLISGTFGWAGVLAGILAIARSREDLVLWTIQGTVGLGLTQLFFLSSAPVAQRDFENEEGTIYALVFLAIALWGIRTFRGAFHQRRRDAKGHGARVVAR
jgi:hypothetical protein